MYATGLDIEKDTIIEIACLVTDGDLRQVVEVRSSQPELAYLASHAASC
jgi:oligoribonuclease (3'-5' exoribonuclease)